MSSDSTRRIIELWKAGTKKIEMEKLTGISRRTIGRIIERYKSSGERRYCRGYWPHT